MPSTWQVCFLSARETKHAIYFRKLSVFHGTESLKFLVWSYLSSLFSLRAPKISNLKLWIKFFFKSVNDRTKCPVIQGFDRTKPIFDRALSVDRPLFQALRWNVWTHARRFLKDFSLKTKYYIEIVPFLPFYTLSQVPSPSFEHILAYFIGWKWFLRVFFRRIQKHINPFFSRKCVCHARKLTGVSKMCTERPWVLVISNPYRPANDCERTSACFCPHAGRETFRKQP